MSRKRTVGWVVAAVALAGCQTMSEEIGLRSGPADMRMSNESVAATAFNGNLAGLEGALVAVNRLSDERAIDFAERVIDEHVDINRHYLDLLADEDMYLDATGMPVNLVLESRPMAERLKGRGVDRDFVNHEIHTHERLLAMLDDLLLPMAEDNDLRQQLRRIRAVESSHLDEARELLDYGMNFWNCGVDCG